MFPSILGTGNRADGLQSFVRSLIKLIQDVPARKKSELARPEKKIDADRTSEHTRQTPSAAHYLHL